MNKKRLILLIAALAVAIVGTLGVLAMMPPGPGVTKANFDRIEVGMTRTDVELLFGGPGRPFYGFVRHQPVRTFVWEADDDSLALVDFTANLVTGREWRPSTESITDKLRRWLRIPK